MAGRVSLGMCLAEITVFAAIMIASLPAKGQDAYLAARTAAQGIARLAEYPGKAWNCLVEAGEVVADGVMPDVRTYGALTRLALNCVSDFDEEIFGAPLGVIASILIAIFTSGAALVADAILGMTHTILDGEGIVSWRVLRNLGRQAPFGDDSNPRNVGYFRLCADPNRIQTDPEITAECGA
jgi:hypothetical protein